MENSPFGISINWGVHFWLGFSLINHPAIGVHGYENVRVIQKKNTTHYLPSLTIIKPSYIGDINSSPIYGEITILWVYQLYSNFYPYIISGCSKYIGDIPCTTQLVPSPPIPPHPRRASTNWKIRSKCRSVATPLESACSAHGLWSSPV